MKLVGTNDFLLLQKIGTPHATSLHHFFDGRIRYVPTIFLPPLGGWAWFIPQEQGGRIYRSSGRCCPCPRSPS